MAGSCIKYMDIPEVPSHKSAKFAVTPFLHARLCPHSSAAPPSTTLLCPEDSLVEITDNSSQIPVNVGWVALNSNWGATGSEGGVKNPLEKHGLGPWAGSVIEVC
jgi:hypothetical protein